MVSKGNGDEQPIIIKKVIKKGGGHHGGAWKVAYADFVTAMMAFFLLLWLLNVSTDDALEEISNYFNPAAPQIADTRSGAGGLMGGTSVSPEGAMVTNVQHLTQPAPTGLAGEADSESRGRNKTQAELEKLEEELRKKEAERFEEAKKQLEEKLKNDPALADLAKNLIIDITPEGLRIQVVDQEGRPMFPSGKAEMYDYTQALMGAIADVITDAPNDISIRGHTDAYQYAPGASYTNWELSADRANSSRRVLKAFGVKQGRIRDVMGKADTDLLLPEQPLAPANRRITIILLNETMEQAFDRGAFEGAEGESKAREQLKQRQQTPPPAYQKTRGDVYFP